MTAEGMLRLVAGTLRETGIPFMLTGSVAAAWHGAGRATMDVDLVVEPTAIQLDDFVGRVAASGAYVSAEAAREALVHRTMFNVVDPQTGWKADLIVRKARAFSEAEFARRQSVDFFGVTLDVASVEDVVLSKLEWAKLGGSLRQIEDVRALLRLRGGECDAAYLRAWVDALALEPQWALATAADTP